MARSHPGAALAGVLALPLALGGCVEMLVVSGVTAAASGGYIAAQDRGVDGLTNDITIKTSIATALLSDPQLQTGVTATVYDGRVLLTGHVSNPALKGTAAQLASRTPNVKRVHDEIEVASVDGIITWDDAKDTWISAQVRSQMLVDAEVHSANYLVATENGSVYLMGAARSQAELERAAHIARHVQGVRRVVSYVELRSGMPVAAGAPAPMSRPAPRAAPAATGRPATAPPTTIEVQKL